MTNKLEQSIDLLHEGNKKDVEKLIREVVSDEIGSAIKGDQHLNEFVDSISNLFSSIGDGIGSLIGIRSETVARTFVSFAASQSARVGIVGSMGLSGATALLIPITGSVVAGLTFRILFTKGKQGRLWKDIERLVQRRDQIIEKIKNSDLPQDEAMQAYGENLERVTNEIREKSTQLYDLITSRKGREGLLREGLTEEQIKQVEQYMKVGMAGGFTNHSKMNEQAKLGLQQLNESSKDQKSEITIKPIYEISDSLIDCITGTYDTNQMKQYEPIAGAAVNNRLLELLFKQGKAKELWNQLNKYVEQRDRIIRSITDQNMSYEQAVEDHGDRLDTLTSSIRETSYKLHNYLTTSKGKSIIMRQNITEKEYEKILSFIENGFETKFSNYLRILSSR